MPFSPILRFSAALSLIAQFAVAQPATPTAQGSVDANGVYSVQNGDTLYGIASRYGLSVAQLSTANGLDGGGSLTVGQGLRIPGRGGDSASAPLDAPVPLAAATGNTGTHQIAQGETLYSIARQYGMSVAALSSANNITDPSTLAIGQTLLIPGGQGSGAASVPGPASAPLAAAAPAAPQTHEVVAGQTLYAISRQYSVSLSDLRTQNGLTESSQILVGQVLQIPTGQASGTTLIASAPTASSGDVTDPTSQVFLGAVNDVPLPSERSDPATAPATSQSARGATPTVTPNATPAPSPNSVPVTAAPNTRVMLPSPPARRSSKFHWPARGKILTRYGAQSSGRQSDGIEIQVSENQAIKAAEDGVVAFAGTGMVGFGHVVVIEHADGYHTAYMKNGGVTVKRGQVVRRDQTIATGGADGKLHFEVRHNSEPVNPISLMVR